ncbi:ABC transporter permease [Eubacterium ruminantium]|uniref:ABC transporter permease n=1 Tax=Eubacterium ruminantium TaxID=42322 RepID=UPI002479E9C3|nr:ABC transporter permease [Eubacterium ruminantium]
MKQSFSQNMFILKELVIKGIRLKYRRSYLGILWSLIEPLLTMIVLTVVFGTLMGVHDKTFPVFILTGRLLFGCFSQATNNSLKSIRANAPMIKKVYVLKILYPLSGIIFNYIIFMISLVVLAIVAVVLGVYPTVYLLQIIVPLINLFLLCTGVGLILSTIGVFFRDMEYLWNVLLMLVMYTCAIFYKPERLLKSRYGIVLKGNPLYCVISNFRSCIFGEVMNYKYLIYSFSFSVVCIIIGFVMFKKCEDRFILNI